MKVSPLDLSIEVMKTSLVVAVLSVSLVPAIK